jgi:hypothetical protein
MLIFRVFVWQKGHVKVQTNNEEEGNGIGGLIPVMRPDSFIKERQYQCCHLSSLKQW